MFPPLRTIPLLIICTLPSLPGSAGAAEAPAAEFFEKRIRPILTENCFKCHSHSGDKIKGGLVVDSLEGLLTGGDTGPAIVPGEPDKSLLIGAVSYADEDLQMPPKGKKLSDEQIATLTEWVKMGAPWPDPGGKKTASRPKGRITDEDRQWWAFQPLSKPAVPQVEDGGWSRNELDHFVFHKQAAAGLKPAPPAAPHQLVRRLYFNLTGLPPTPAEADAFAAEHARDAQAAVGHLIDRLLASPRYGERWARHWLDLVRYAESDGFRIDDYRPHAWRYRDYVIQAFNHDKPYDRFVAEQIAGDEIAPDDLDARVATGFLRHWLYEYNNRDAVSQWANILNDLTDVTADVFMGMGLQCARCHDHKFDPILQKDYYRLQAFFAPLLPRDDLKVATPEQEAAFQEKLATWEEQTAELRQQIATLEAPHREKAAQEAIAKFPPETQALIRKPAAERTPLEHQIAELAYRQVTYEFDRLINKMRGPDKEKLVALYKQLSAFDKIKPEPLPEALAATDVGPAAPPVLMPKRKDEEIAPGFLSVLDEKPALIQASLKQSTGRRTALARWLTDPENPLTTRVIVNRVWQYHFGRGLAAFSSDFGKLGEPPSHPELLDWLARWFVENGWSFKKLHRLILTSATYQQSTHNPQVAVAGAANPQVVDPENRLLWRASTRRLDAEQIRDAILSATGELDLTAGGPSTDATKPRRTIYTKVIRNTRDPLLEVFDVPEGFSSMSQRNVTTTPTQSLHMINSPWSLQRARDFGKRLAKEAPSSDPGAAVDHAYRLAFARAPQGREREAAIKFLQEQMELPAGKVSETKNVPFVSDKMPFRDGRAALIAPGLAQDRLTVADHPAFPRADFTVEAFIVLKSLYETGEVRTIASHWDGTKGHPGWSLGVTSKQSRYKPQTLVLLLSGDQPFSDKDPVEPIFSGLHIGLGKPYFVAVAVKLDDESEKGVTFYAKDLSNDDEPMQVSGVKHKVTSGIRSNAPFVIGARTASAAGPGAAGNQHLFDGLIDDVRISRIPLPQEQLLFSKDSISEHTAAFWRFEADPGVYKDSSPRGADILARAMDAPREDSDVAALADLCHVLLNSNEFLYVD